MAACSLMLVIIIGWLALQVWGSKQAELRAQLARQATTFALYYPGKLPDGVVIEKPLVENHEGILMFTLKQTDNTITITQQARPKVMEEVVKTRDIQSPLGKAYAATLNNRPAGFLVTNETLLIISSVKDLSVDSLEALLKSLEPV